MTRRPTKLPERLALGLLSLSIVLGAGCAGISAAPNPGFIWKRVGIGPDGCPMYTKQSTDPNVIVDGAIWYRTLDGHYVLNPKACHDAQGARRNN